MEKQEDPRPSLELEDSNWREAYNDHEGPVCGHDWNDWWAEREIDDA